MFSFMQGTSRIDRTENPEKKHLDRSLNQGMKKNCIADPKQNRETGRSRLV